MKGSWSAYVGIPAWILLVNLLNLGRYRYNWTTYWTTSLLVILYIFLFWYAGLWWVKQVQTRFPAMHLTRQRMLLTFGGYLLGVLSIQALLLFLLSRSGLLNWTVSPAVYAWQAVAGLLAVGITGGIYEFTYYFGLYRQAVDETKASQKALFASQLETLRQQVNPHFLFNSLNILDSLIEENPPQARQFLEELSTVYRYLLRANDQPLTDLGSELDFIQSYFHLLKTRYGNALTLILQVRSGTEACQLPPLTLQLLIENAVKHNIILPDQPLTIRLSTDENRHLIVSNNLQRKPSRPLSNGVGLSNILTKYRMLGYSLPRIEDDGREFRVILPLV
ncbi:sensor histidine kinase [Larkinella sp. VNQ87]|uniref:sensor histidine kinase n=1 Tax=Larkinella sp. VNQ87 TaxID=3400921 RepID=UPI003C0AB85A